MKPSASPRLHARIAGALYLLVVIAGSFALYVGSTVIVRGDAAATAANLVAGEQMFRLAFAANLLACAAYVAVVAILYELMAPVSRTLSVVAAFFGLAGCAASGAGMASQLAPLYWLGEQPYLDAFTAEQLEAISQTSLRVQGLGGNISLMFFGFYCATLGAVVLGAKFLPRILGIVLIIAGAGWLVGSFTSFIAPHLSLSAYLLPVSGLGEFAFTLWLLFVGVNETKWREQAGAS